MDLWTIILTVIGGVLCIYLFGTQNHNYFKKLGIPYVKPLPIFGNMAGMIFKAKSLIDVVQEAYDSNSEARYVGCYDFLTPIIVLKDPELVKLIAIKNFDTFTNHRMFIDSPTEPLFQKNLFVLQDDTWRDMRSVLTPAFTSSKMKMMFDIMLPCAVNLADCLSKQNTQNERLDMKNTFERYTIDIIASSAFGLTVNSMKDRDNDFYIMGKEVTSYTSLKMIRIQLMKNFPLLANVFKIKVQDPKITDFFMNVIKNTIATRDAKGIVRPDMIHLMMQARDRKEKSVLSPEDIAAQAFIFFSAGLSNPATTMSFAALLLAMNPNVQRKLQTEIDQVLEKCSDDVTYDDLHMMKYLDAVVNETLRIFPPITFLDRVASKSFTLPPTLPGLDPVHIKTGQNIWLPTYSFHHDPNYFPNPEKFDPERFDEDNESKINPMTYLPFGLGPRICIANRFALMEIKLALFHVLAKCNLLPTPKTPPVINLNKKSFILIPEGGFNLKVEPRI